MRTLIDGYNVMFAAGLLGKTFGPDGFRRVRTRFLNDLASRLGPVEAHLTTVVFDAKKVFEGLPSQVRHKGITVFFAVDNPTADERIAELIREHSDPKKLTVISSDNQVRTAAKRRRASSVTADDFLTKLDQAIQKRAEAARASAPEKPGTVSEAESAFWLREFAELDRSGEVKAAFERDSIFPSDEEIAKIEREIEQEFREGR
jgi:predicted RNA-binding protein with PIN domain